MFIDKAKEYLNSGLNPVPLELGGKVPVRKNWGSPIENVDDYNFSEIGICTGAISGGLEGLDFDLKYSDNPDNLWSVWKSKIPKSILSKLVVCKTKNNGYHILYRCNSNEGNRKLAKNERNEVIIETRGEGGYLKCYPSEGYEVIYGDLTKINKIPDFERDILISTSILFDETLTKKKKYYSDNREYKDPFPEYNSDPEIGLELLENNGWTISRESNIWVELTRPGKTEGVSAGYNLEGNFLYVFTTSTEFEPEQPYPNSAIFCLLENDGNFRKGYAKLGELGYGKKIEASDSDTIEDELDNLSFISHSGEDEEKIIQAIKGELPLGLSFGWDSLDEYCLFKENTLNFVLAFEGVGKTWMVLHKLVSLSVLYGKKFAITCGENEVSNVKRIIVEALSGKDISYFKNNFSEYKKYMDYLHAHFFVFKNEKHYTIEEILERVEVIKKLHNIDGVLIDPFSYYKRPLTNTYAYTDDLLSKLHIFSKKVCSVFMTVHPTTDATRAPRDAEGYLKPPTQYDAIGGNIFANRSDQFMVYHRIRNHKIASMRSIMEIRQYKIKDETTGGKVTPVNESVALTFKTVNGFKGYFDNQGNNPIYNKWHKNKTEKVEKDLPKMSTNDDIF